MYYRRCIGGYRPLSARNSIDGCHPGYDYLLAGELWRRKP